MRKLDLSRMVILSLCAVWCLGAPSPSRSLPPQAPPQKLTLKDAEAMALRNHPLVLEATYDTAAAEQVAREAKSAYYPTAAGNLTGAAGGPSDNSRIAAGFINNPRVFNREADGL